MKVLIGYGFALGLISVAAVLPLTAQNATAVTGPVELRVDSLKTPLGIDDPAPHFSWQLRDPARGARQIAYEVLVASESELLREGKPDVWDSGRIDGGQSLDVRYGGPAFTASTRYFWQVKVWNVAGKPYSPSGIEWFETGLLRQDAWRAQWIGYETPEESEVRHAPAMWISSS